MNKTFVIRIGSLGLFDFFHLHLLTREVVANLDVYLLTLGNSVLYISYLSHEAARVPWAGGQDKA